MAEGILVNFEMTKTIFHICRPRPVDKSDRVAVGIGKFDREEVAYDWAWQTHHKYSPRALPHWESY